MLPYFYDSKVFFTWTCDIMFVISEHFKNGSRQDFVVKHTFPIFSLNNIDFENAKHVSTNNTTCLYAFLIYQFIRISYLSTRKYVVGTQMTRLDENRQNGRSKIDKTKILMTSGSLIKVESIAECSPWSILQYF